MSNKKFNVLILFCILTVYCLVSCKSPEVKNNTKDSNPHATTEEKKETTNKKAQTLKIVEGAKEGSLSNLVIDREIWNEFIDEKYFDEAKGPINGVHLPKILLDSEDARKANEEIDKIKNGLKSSYEKFQDDDSTEQLGISSEFSVFQDEDVLSLHIRYCNVFEEEIEQNKIYNFSISDGKLLSDDEVLENFGVKSGDKLSLMEDGISNDYKLYREAFDRNVTDSSFIYNIGNLEGLTLNNLWDTVNDKDSKVFVDEVGRLMFLYQQYTNAGPGMYEAITELKGKSIRESIYQRQYLKMARKMGVDIKDKNNKGFLIFLGYSQDEYTLKEILSKLYVWQDVYNEYEDPSLLLNIKENEEDFKPEIIGQEYYLFVPKLKNTTISLKELEVSEEGKLKEVPNYYLEQISLTGPTLICQNISEIAPNGKIIMRYRDDKFEFSPSISLKDGSIMLPDEIINAENILDWNMLSRQEMYSTTIFDRILSLMGRG